MHKILQRLSIMLGLFFMPQLCNLVKNLLAMKISTSGLEDFVLIIYF